MWSRGGGGGGGPPSAWPGSGTGTGGGASSDSQQPATTRKHTRTHAHKSARHWHAMQTAHTALVASLASCCPPPSQSLPPLLLSPPHSRCTLNPLLPSLLLLPRRAAVSNNLSLQLRHQFDLYPLRRCELETRSYSNSSSNWRSNSHIKEAHSQLLLLPLFAPTRLHPPRSLRRVALLPLLLAVEAQDAVALALLRAAVLLLPPRSSNSSSRRRRAA